MYLTFLFKLFFNPILTIVLIFLFDWILIQLFKFNKIVDYYLYSTDNKGDNQTGSDYVIKLYHNDKNFYKFRIFMNPFPKNINGMNFSKSITIDINDTNTYSHSFIIILSKSEFNLFNKLRLLVFLLKELAFPTKKLPKWLIERYLYPRLAELYVNNIDKV
jgi:hypothetical protein